MYKIQDIINSVIQGDSLQVLKQFPDNCIDKYFKKNYEKKNILCNYYGFEVSKGYRQLKQFLHFKHNISPSRLNLNCFNADTAWVSLLELIMPKYYEGTCAVCGKRYRGRGKIYCSNHCSAIIKNKEIAEKVSITMKLLYKNKILIPSMKGKKHTQEWKINASKRMKINNPMNNKDNIEKVKSSLKLRWDKIGRKTKRIFNTEYKIWRDKIFKKDNYTCQICNKQQCYLEAHHIKTWKKHPELRFELSNGITLCRNCHIKLHNSNGKKNYI